MGVPDLEQRLPSGRELGGFVRREAPASGLRPTVRFLVAFTLTLFWVGFSIWVSEPWRSELEAAIGPVMGWVIPIFLAYIPGLVIWFMIFTLLITRYEPLPLEPPAGEWDEGEWPSVSILVAAWNESASIVRTLEHIAGLTYPGRVRGDRGRQQLDRRHRGARRRGRGSYDVRLPAGVRGEAG